MGKLKTGCWQEATAHYLNLLRKWRPVEYMEVRDGGASLETPARIRKESTALLERMDARDTVIALADTGRMFTSPQFATFLRNMDEKGDRPAFVIGGPYGLDENIMRRSGTLLSLSPMTWPHELARVLLLEQLFRAESILRNFPYHNGAKV